MPLASNSSKLNSEASAAAIKSVQERMAEKRRSSHAPGVKEGPSAARLSLPNTVPSTTVVTKSKVERRRSILRNKENAKSQEAPYSPPQTRSHKKQKLSINPSFFDAKNQANAMLHFSPPNHELNLQREQERIKKQEYERALRIEKLRRSGQLLLLSPDQNDALSSIPVKEPEDTKAAPVATSSIKPEELLLKMSEDVSRLAQIQTEADRNRRTSEAELLQKVHDMIAKQKENDLQLQRRQSLDLSCAAVLQVEQTKNEQLIQELKEINAKLLSEKESYMVQATKLEMQLQQAQSQLIELEQLNSSLQNENLELRDIVTQLQTKVDGLEQALQALRTQISTSEKHLQEVTGQNDVQTESLSNEILQLQQLNSALSSKYEQAVQSHEAIQATILLCQSTIQHYERDTIPNLEATIEMERDTIARLEERFNSQQDKEALEYQEVTKKLQEQLKQAQDMYEQEHLDLVNSQKECSSIHIQWNEYQACKEKAFQDMSDEIEQLKNMNASLQSINEKYLLQQKEINDALEESMMQNEQFEQEKNDLSLKLQHTIQQLNGMQNLIANKDSEISVQVKQLNDQLVAERHNGDRLRIESDRTVQSQNQQIAKLQQQVQQYLQERDEARSNMAGYNERENQLFQQLVHYENVRRSLHRKLIQYMGNIRVFIRIRPKLPSECMVHAESLSNEKVASKTDAKRKLDQVSADGEEDIFRYPGMFDNSSAVTETSEMPSVSSADLTKNIVEVVAPYKDRGGLKDRRTKWRFGFDQVFTPKHSQQDVWEATEPLVQCAVDGYNVTLFAYGQTGSGKTYTMLGEEGINEGIIGRTVRKLFDEKQKIIDLSRNTSHVSMFVELLEIYNEKVYDLMSTSKEEIKVTSNEVVGNILVETKTAHDVFEILKLAQSRRCVKATKSNAVSSRSHLIFTIHFNVQIDDTKTRTGKINICDLAGSERLNKSGANLVGGALLEETKNINSSLSVLSNVIEKLQAGETKNVPYRESKLTFLLKNSLSGNSKTLAIVCCNPMASHMSESLCSLRFAEKVNRVDLKAVTNYSC